MDIGTLANLINALAVTAGVIFAAAQISYYRQRRHRDWRQPRWRLTSAGSTVPIQIKLNVLLPSRN